MRPTPASPHAAPYGARSGRLRVARWSTELFSAARDDLAVRCVGLPDALSWVALTTLAPAALLALAVCPEPWWPAPIDVVAARGHDDRGTLAALCVSALAIALHVLVMRAAAALALVFGHPGRVLTAGARIAAAAAWCAALVGAVALLGGRMIAGRADLSVPGLALDAVGGLSLIVSLAGLARALAPVRLTLADAAQIGVVAGTSTALLLACARVILGGLTAAIVPWLVSVVVTALAACAVLSHSFLLAAGVVAERRERRSRASQEQRDLEMLRATET